MTVPTRDGHRHLGGARRTLLPAGWSTRLGLLLVLLLAGVMTAGPALAHSLDERVLASYLTVGADTVTVEVKDSPGVLVAGQALAEVDVDGDGTITDAEAQAWASEVVAALEISLDGEALDLVLTDVEVPEVALIQQGYGEIRVTAVAVLPAAAGTLAFANTASPDQAVHQANVFVADDAEVTLGTPVRDDAQQTLTVSIEPAVADSGDGGEVVDEGSGEVDEGSGAERLLAFVRDPGGSPGLLLATLGLAAGLGALHALTPGHGKALAAAWLVGERGTVGNAVALGIVVTVTHTASVVGIGLLALFASAWLAPGVLAPALQVASGAIVLALGLRLLRRHLAARRTTHHRAAGAPADVHGHDHGQAHDHGRAHAHGHAHDHGHGHRHDHLPADLRLRSIVGIGISGGIIPCPEALAVLIAAVTLNRIGLGLALIGAFSVGLAAVLVGVGILVVRGRGLIDRAAGASPRLTAAIPLASAAVITLIGVSFVLSGVGAVA